MSAVLPRGLLSGRASLYRNTKEQCSQSSICGGCRATSRIVGSRYASGGRRSLSARVAPRRVSSHGVTHACR
ncbi:hypothetical protein FA95DRAFT_49131 [Auriscalpium vulgare]|uniref:Uncharacterized protein n=1 Tax=Auriscalpium vulgare TaxID=40419 RepID=A0ACB8SEB5_9AGAM|nr:hypothetical protein FA95DRAFT_49131 [Auriscalpium vulgare]